MADQVDATQRNNPANRGGFGAYSMWYDEVASKETALFVALCTLCPDEKVRQRTILDLEVRLAMGPNYRSAVKNDQFQVVEAEVRRRPQMLKFGRDADRWAKGEIAAPGLREEVEAAFAGMLKAFGFTKLAEMERLVMTKAPSDIARLRRN